MSHNLCLVDLTNSRNEAPLMHVGTLDTKEILYDNPDKAEGMRRYFAWLDANTNESWGPGSILDHKLKVAVWMVENPACRWEAT